VERVVLSATIRDRQGKLVAEVDKEELRVFEDEVEQEILQVGVETRPIRMALLIDDSGSMKTKLSHAQTSAKHFVETLRPEDQALVIAFASEVRVLHDFTSNQERLIRALDLTRAEGGTAMYDALMTALEKFGVPSQDERRVVVLLSDGADSASSFSSDDVSRKAREKGVMIYSIGFTQSGMRQARITSRPGAGSNPYNSALDQIHQGGAVLRALADESGGRVFLLMAAGELSHTYLEIAAELRTQFEIVYRSSNPAADGTWREVKVEPHRKGKYIIRTKSEYKAR